MKGATKMKNTKRMKRGLALFLALCLIFTYSGVTTFGATGDNTVIVVNPDNLAVDNSGDIDVAAPLAQGEMRTGKTVLPIDGSEDEGLFEVTLSVIGRQFTNEVITEVPVCYDVVFVLDYSGSMDTAMTGTSTTRLQAMQAAATTAVNQILSSNDPLTPQYYNRVAVISYAEGASILRPWGAGVTWGTTTISGISGATASRTNTMAGMNQAYQILNARAGSDANRPAVIILMSDGQPNGYYESFTNHNLTRGVTTTTASNPDNMKWTGNGSSQDASVDSVYYTIKCIEDIKARMSGLLSIGDKDVPKLEIYSIGFALGGFTNTTSNPQRQFAYACLFPSQSNLNPSPALTGINTGANNLLSRLGGASFKNPVDQYQDATADVNSIAKAFTHIIESIKNNDPVIAGVEIFDMIDGNYEIVPGTFRIDGAGAGSQPSNVTVTGGQLKWTVTGFNRLPSEGDGVIGEIKPSTLSFQVKVAAAAMNEGNLNKTLYTNTDKYSSTNKTGDGKNPNYAVFAPKSENPYYYKSNGSATGVADPVTSNGTATQNLLSTGKASLMAFDGLVVTKERAAGSAGFDGRKFEITVTLTGEDLPNGFTYGGVSAKDNGNNSYTIELAEGESFLFGKLPVGTAYVVSEGDLPYDYRKHAVKSGVIGVGGEGVVIKNYRKAADIQVVKEVVGLNDSGAVAPVGENDKVFTAGELVVYSIVITNNGQLPLRHVKWVEDQGFAGPFHTFADAQDPSGDAFTPRSGGYALGVGRSMTVFYTYTVPADSQNLGVTNTVDVSGVDPGGNPVTDSDCEAVEFAHPILSVEKEILIDGAGVKFAEFESGETALFRITVTNNGSAAAKDITLSDVWTDGYGNATSLTSEIAGYDGPFDLAPGGSAVFTCTVDLQGMTRQDVKNLFDDMIEEIDNEIAGYEDFIGSAPDMMDAAWNSLETAFAEFGVAPDENGSIWRTFNYLESYEDPEDGGGYDPDDIDSLRTALEDYYEADAIYGEAKVADAIVAKAAVQEKKDDLCENGLTVEQMQLYANNEVRATLPLYGTDTSDVDLIINPDLESGFSIEKYVSLDEGDDKTWHKAVVKDYTEGTAYYKVVITNTGTAAGEVTLTDSKQPDLNKVIELNPQGTHEEFYELPIASNDDYYRAKFIPNTAKITFTVDGQEQELKSSALATVLSKPYAELLIDKKVSYDSGRWSSGLAVYSDGPIEVTYRVKVMNIGTQTAVFELGDDKYSGPFFTDAGCGAPYGDVDAIALRPLESVTLYYQAELDAKLTKNTATYTITSGNAKNDKTTGSDSAIVRIDAVPTVDVSLTKEVVTEDEFNSVENGNYDGLGWRDSAQIMNKYGKGAFWFRITVQNNGNYPADVRLSDVMSSDNSVYDFGEGFEEALAEAGVVLDDDEYMTLDAGGGKQVFYIKASVQTPESSDEIRYTNVVTFEDGTDGIRHDMPAGFEATDSTDYENGANAAKISVVKTDTPVVELNIKKLVEDGDGNMVDAANFRGGGVNAHFQIILTATWDTADEISEFAISGNVSDLLDDVPVSSDDFNGSFILTGEKPKYIIDYHVNLGVGTHKNVAIIDEGLEFDKEEITVNTLVDRDEATAVITNNSGNNHNNGGSGDNPNPPADTAIAEPDVPLATIPEDDVIITEENVPLADIPQTGIDDMGFNLLMLGVSLSALLAALFGRKKVNN